MNHSMILFDRLEQHLTPSLAEIIRISFGFGPALIVVAVGLNGANSRDGRQGRRRDAGRGGWNETTQRRHRLCSATRHGQRMTTRQRLLAVAGRRSSAASTTSSIPSAAKLVQTSVMISSSLHLNKHHKK